MKKIKWENYWEKRKNRKPKICSTVIKIDKNVFVDVHTDIAVYDFKNKKAWKGDLV